MGGSRPPFCALPGSSEYFFASSSKSRAGLQLLLDILGLRLRSLHAFGIDLAVGAGRRSLDQNVTDGNRLGNAELVLMLVVVRLQVGLRHRNRTRPALAVSIRM